MDRGATTCPQAHFILASSHLKEDRRRKCCSKVWEGGRQICECSSAWRQKLSPTSPESFYIWKNSEFVPQILQWLKTIRSVFHVWLISSDLRGNLQLSWDQEVVHWWITHGTWHINEISDLQHPVFPSVTPQLLSLLRLESGITAGWSGLL